MEEAPLSIRLLGGFEVRVGGQPMRSGRTRSVEWLLALLVLRHGRGYPQSGWVPRAWLAGTLWPESSEAQALFNLRRNLLDLRQALGPAAARIGSPNRATLYLDLTGADVDVVAFDAAIAAGDEHSLQAAVSLYRGPLLEGCVADWAFAERASREEVCLLALETLADRAAARGEWAAARGYLGHAAALDPLRDSTQRRRMQALAASGDLPAALLTYREHRLRLYRELNVDPDPETTQLFQELRAGGRDRETGRQGDRGHLTLSARPVSPSPPPPIFPASLPRPLTALIGREQEVPEIVQRVRSARLVTLVGGGGVGKTRLAIEAAAALAPDFPAGAAFIELAGLAEPALLSAHLAAALGVREADADPGAGPPGAEPLVQALCDWLTRHPVLLVLDNCEHLIEAVAALAHSLLMACPALRVLATSRQRLGITGEVIWRVPSLPVPDESWELRVESASKTGPSDGSTPNPPAARVPELSTLMQYPAVQLFTERAAAVRSGFGLENREEALAVARICRRLDGIPLALELAAARAALLTLPQIAARLDDRFHLLTGGSRVALPRHQTLAALIDWSYELLPEAERALLRRLSVFAGGWTLEAAEAVCADARDEGKGMRDEDEGPIAPSLIPHPSSLIPGDVLDLLGALEEKSLVLVDQAAGGLRYRMLETVREYAREKLQGSGELAAIRSRHRDWALQLAERVEAEMARSGRQAVLMARLDAELDNFRAALAWCQEQADAHPATPEGAAGEAAEAGLILATRLGQLSYTRGNLGEGRRWLEAALARSPAAPASLRAAGLLMTAYLIGREDRDWRAYREAARREWERALELARQAGDQRQIALALVSLAEVTASGEDLDARWSLCVEARQLFDELGDPFGLARALGWLAQIAQSRKDRAAARPLLEERLAIHRKLGESDYVFDALGGLGHLERDDGNYDRARAVYQESLRLRQKLGHQMALAQSLEDFAVLAGREQQFERAIRLLGAGEAFCETLGARPPVAVAAEYERTVAAGLAALGEAAFAAAWAEGRAMSLEEAVTYASDNR